MGEKIEIKSKSYLSLLSQALRKISGAINKNDTVAIFINQVREKIGVMFGNPETTTGGRALKFYASQRIEVRRSEAIKKGTDIIGNKTNIKIVKNKIAPPFRTAQVDIMYGEGISSHGSILTLATDYDIVAKSGSWYSYQGERLGQGELNVKIKLREEPALCREIENKVRECMGLPKNETPLPLPLIEAEDDNIDLELD